MSNNKLLPDSHLDHHLNNNITTNITNNLDNNIDNNITPINFTDSALHTLDIELEMISYLRKTINSPSYQKTCQVLFDCSGKVVCMGVGKSGHIARKISASLASTGTNSIFIHPCEAGHGDIGVINKEDVVLYISNSGESQEFNLISPFFESNNIPIIAITNNVHSTLAQKSSVVLELNVKKEACPLNLAPTSTTTNSLVLGDCIVISLLEAKQFNLDDFSKSHPSGSLGKRLLTTNNQVMRLQDQLPIVNTDMTISESLLPMSNKNLGCVFITDKNDPNTCLGIFTDGDLRRTIDRKIDLYTTPISEVMSSNFIFCREHELAYNALNILKNKNITVMPVFDENDNLTGAVHIHDLLKFGL